MRTQRRQESPKEIMQEVGWQAPLHLSEALITTLCIWDVERRRTNKIRIRAAELARPRAALAENTLGFRSMQVIFWLHRLKVVFFLAQPPGRRVRQSGSQTIRQRGGRPKPTQVPDRADSLEKQRRLSAHSAGESIISYTDPAALLTGGELIRRCVPGSV